MRKTYLILVLVIMMALAIFGLSAGSALAAPLIVIDAGHSGGTLLSTDPQFNMYDYEYNNGQENYENWNVAVALKAKLEAAGYRVLLTKTGPEDIVSKRARVNLANNNGAALLVSIHRDDHTFGAWGHVYVQRVGDWRADVNGKHVAFNLPGVAAKSAAIGQAILNARRAIEGTAITMAVENFTGREGYIPDGTLSILQLWATVPSILCEAGICDTAAKQDKYAQGVFNGIVASIPVDGTVTPPPPSATPTRYQSDVAQVHKTGIWSKFTATDASGGSYQRSATSGASVTIGFNGTRLDIIAMKGTTTGVMDVYLDGAKKATINTAVSVASYQLKLWTTGDISNGYHTVKIVRSSSSASTKYLTLDAVDIMGTIAP